MSCVSSLFYTFSFFFINSMMWMWAEAGAPREAMMQSHHRLNRSDIWVGNRIIMMRDGNEGSISNSRLLETDAFMSCEETTRFVVSNDDGRANTCMASAEEMMQFAMMKLRCPQEQLLQVLHDDRMTSKYFAESEAMMLIVAETKSVSMDYVVCHELSFPYALFQCKAMQHDINDAELISVKLIIMHMLPSSSSSSSSREVNVVLQCRNEEGDGSCKWIGERSMVWVRKDELESSSSSSSSKDENEETKAWRNEKLFQDLGYHMDQAVNNTVDSTKDAANDTGNYFKRIGNAITNQP